jgi:hypothetical protein
MLESIITLAITIGLIALLRPLWMWAFGVYAVLDELQAIRKELEWQNRLTTRAAKEKQP